MTLREYAKLMNDTALQGSLSNEEYLLIWILSFLVVTVTGGHKYFISIVKAISISVNLLI